jgi:hypothetical protein
MNTKTQQNKIEFHLENFHDRLKLERRFIRKFKEGFLFLIYWTFLVVILFYESQSHADSFQLRNTLEAKLGLAELTPASTNIQNSILALRNFTELTMKSDFFQTSSPIILCLVPKLTIKAVTSQTNYRQEKVLRLWKESGLLALYEQESALTISEASEPFIFSLPSSCLCKTDSKILTECFLNCDGIWDALIDSPGRIETLQVTYFFYSKPFELFALLELTVSQGTRSSKIDSVPAKHRLNFAHYLLGALTTVFSVVGAIHESRRKSEKSLIRVCNFLVFSIGPIIFFFQVYRSVTTTPFADTLLLVYQAKGLDEENVRMSSSLIYDFQQTAKVNEITRFTTSTAFILCSLYKFLLVSTGHPRTAILANTLFLLSWDLAQFVVIFGLLFAFFALVRYDPAVWWNQTLMLLQAFPDISTFENYLILYAVLFGITMGLCLIAFLQVLIVLSYKQYKLDVEEVVVEQTVWKDALWLIQLFWWKYRTTVNWRARRKCRVYRRNTSELN